MQTEMYFLETSGALFVGCFLLTLALTPLIMRLAHRIGAVDEGGFRKITDGAIPLLGGLSIALPFVVLNAIAFSLGYIAINDWEWLYTHFPQYFDAVYSLAASRSNWLLLAIGALIIVALGIIDDIYPIGAKWKLTGQSIAAVLVCASGNDVSAVTLPIIGSVEFGSIIGWSLTFFWIVGMINAFNLIDGIDGLASGIALVGAFALLVLNYLQGNLIVAFACAALAGSIIAFLVYNFPPAKIFLGDTGSMFLGFTLAMLSLLSAQKGEAAVIILAPILALSFPIFETFVSIIRRQLRGAPIFVGDNLHTHHRLLSKGYSQPRVVLTLCATALCLACSAILSIVIPPNSEWGWISYALFFGALVNVAWMAGYLRRPSAFKMAFERRQRNRLFQNFGRYAALGLRSQDHTTPVEPLFEICRSHFGVDHLALFIDGREAIISRSHDAPEIDTDNLQRLELRAAEGESLLFEYRFCEHADEVTKQDVKACIAFIFESVPIERFAKIQVASNSLDPAAKTRSKSFWAKGGR